MNSYRSEVYASLVSQLFQKTYAEYFQVPIEIKITSCCDNKAYVERLTNCISDPHLTRGLFKKNEQKAYRIIFQIQTSQFKSFTSVVTKTMIKKIEEVEILAQLNIEVDIVAITKVTIPINTHLLFAPFAI